MVEDRQADSPDHSSRPRFSDDGSVAAISPKPADGLTMRPCRPPASISSPTVRFLPRTLPLNPTGSAQAATKVVKRPTHTRGLSDLRLENILADIINQNRKSRRVV
jgi:hypothetical protein